MSGAVGVLQRVRARSEGGKRGWVRIVCLSLAVMLLVPMLLMMFSGSAMAAGDEDQDSYSLYDLGSRASAFFNNANTPGENGYTLTNTDNDVDWPAVLSSPANGGGFLGFADESSGFLGWLFSSASGSSQTVKYSALTQSRDGVDISGLLDYAHYGATISDLGMSHFSGSMDIISVMVHAIAGAIVMIFYLLAIGVGWLFGFIIDILQWVNPFKWFYTAVQAISPTFAEGMVNGDTDLGAFSGLANAISQWFGVIYGISMNVLIPLFVGVLLLMLFLYKKMKRGSALKKLVVRVVFLVVGLPLLGSMYTGVLDKMDTADSGFAGATKVVLSTYVDYESWGMDERFAVPDGAVIEWSDAEGGASSKSVMSARSTSLAVNILSNNDFSGLTAPNSSSSASGSWKNNNPSLSDNCDADDASDDCASEDGNLVSGTLGLLGRYIISSKIQASDFESAVKQNITEIDAFDGDAKKAWFLSNPYKDIDDNDFGQNKDGGPAIQNHPLFAVKDGTGLTASKNEGVTTFSSTSVADKCGAQILTVNGNAGKSCNLSPMANYNFLNTKFQDDSLTLYSTKKLSSGMVAETPDSVVQVGTGLMSFMYWFNTVVLLVCITVLGLVYAFGMLFGAVKRTVGLVSAVPFAMLGALSGIAKVITYSIALILEVIVTLFLYNFVSEILLSIPGIIEGPMSSLMDSPVFSTMNLASGGNIGMAVLLLMTLFSSILLIVVTIGLLKVRGTALKGLNEAATKVVDKFLETDTVPPSPGGVLPAMAAGAGAGAGMAMGRNLMDRGGSSGPKAPNEKGSTAGGPTNTGGLNGPSATALPSGTRTAGAIEAGPGAAVGEIEGPNGPGELPGGSGGPAALPGGSHVTSNESTTVGEDGGAGFGGDGASGQDGSDGQRLTDMNGNEFTRNADGSLTFPPSHPVTSMSDENIENTGGAGFTRNPDGSVSVPASSPVATMLNDNLGQFTSSGSTAGSTAQTQPQDDRGIAEAAQARGGLGGSTPGQLALGQGPTSVGGTNAPTKPGQSSTSNPSGPRPGAGSQSTPPRPGQPGGNQSVSGTQGAPAGAPGVPQTPQLPAPGNRGPANQPGQRPGAPAPAAPAPAAPSAPAQAGQPGRPGNAGQSGQNGAQAPGSNSTHTTVNRNESVTRNETFGNSQSVTRNETVTRNESVHGEVPPVPPVTPPTTRRDRRNQE